jgi:hypothetical protein
MTKQYRIIYLVAAAMLVAASVIIISKKNQQAAIQLLPVDLHALKMTDGWGYEVLVDKKVYIHQDCIPAIPLYKKFNSEAEALLIGNKVIEKIKKGNKPSITLRDINEAHIHY